MAAPELEKQSQPQQNVVAIPQETTKQTSHVSENSGPGQTGTDLMFAEVGPWTEPADPKDLLDQVAETIRRFVIIDSMQADALALWVGHTHFFQEAQISPIAIVNAPEKECAKTLLQDVLSRISSRH